jgi:hypothetical protein
MPVPGATEHETLLFCGQTRGGRSEDTRAGFIGACSSPPATCSGRQRRVATPGEREPAAEHPPHAHAPASAVCPYP